MIIKKFTAKAFLAFAVLFLGGCETVQFGPDTETPPADTSSNSSLATLKIWNQRLTDPGTLTFLLYRTSAQSIEAASPERELADVPFDSMVTVTLPAGKWKIGYRTVTGDLQAMPAEENEDQDADWPVATFAKGKTYGLLLFTNEGGVNYWQTDVPTD